MDTPYFTLNELRVSIHASSREDATIRKPPRIGTARFNPRVLAGGRDMKLRLLMRLLLGFNPRVLAGGRDRFLPFTFIAVRVSIHASSREDATVSVESNINQNVTFAKARRK